MTSENSGSRIALDALAGRLVAETGISSSQARELISLLGMNWTSLIREAKLICAGKH